MIIQFKEKMIVPAITVLMFPIMLWASSEAAGGVDWFETGVGLFGGLALFLAGLNELTDGLKMAAGDRLKNTIKKMTKNRFMGLFSGTLVTAALNSSSVTIVLIVGFVTAGAMTLQQSVAVIMGANIGSTVTGQLLAFDISKYSLLAVATGFLMMSLAKKEKIQYYGMVLFGLGLVFFGMGVMSDAMYPLRSYPPFIDFLKEMESPAVGILAGAIFTALIQSSSATVGISIVLASEGVLSLPAGIALALGANVGTCITALLASMGKPVEAVRTSVVHILFNLLGVLIWLPFIQYLSDIAIAISPVSEGLHGMEKMAEEVPRQIANANTFFNIANALIFIGFTPWFAKMAIRLVPEREKRERAAITPKYLDEDAFEMPSTALDNVRLETARSLRMVEKMFVLLKTSKESGYDSLKEELGNYFHSVQVLTKANLLYLGNIGHYPLTEKDSAIHQNLVNTNTVIDGIASILNEKMEEYAIYMAGEEYNPSQTTREYLSQIIDKTAQTLTFAEKGLKDQDQNAFEKILETKEGYIALMNRFMQRKTERLTQADESYIKVVKTETSLVDTLYHIFQMNQLLATYWTKGDLLRLPLKDEDTAERET